MRHDLCLALGVTMRITANSVALLAGTLIAVAHIITEVQAQADAMPVSEAGEHFSRGLELFDEQDYEKALIEFQKAHEIKPNNKVLYNIGITYVNLARPVEAVDVLQTYMLNGGATAASPRPTDVQVEIERQKARIAYLMLVINPSGATVKIDDKKIAENLVRDPIRVGLGTHRITVSFNGYQDSQITVKLAGKEKKRVEITLKRVELSGLVDVQCPISDVRILVDGKFTGQTPLSTPLTVVAGDREFVFERPGYSRVSEKVNVPEESMARIACKLEVLSPLPATLSARLEVKPSEPDATVIIDGEPFLSAERTPVGKHRVEVRRTGFENYQSEIVLKAGESKTLNALLIPETDYLRDYQSRATLQRILACAIGGTGIALGIASVVIFAWNDGKYGDWEEEKETLDTIYSNKEPYPDDVDQRQSENDSLLKSIQDWDAVTIGTAIAGGVFLTAGIVLLLTGDDPGKYDDIMVKIDKSNAAIEWSTKW